MKKLSKRQYKNKIKVNNTSVLSLETSIPLLKETATAKFIESVEAHIKLNLNLNDLNHRVSKTIILPHNRGKEIRIAVLTKNKDIAKKEGADIIGSDDLIEQISQKNINFDILLSTPEMIPKLVKLGKLLGPRGLMPSLKKGTLVKDLELGPTILEFKRGKFEYKTDKTGNIHTSFGKTTLSNIHLIENLRALYMSIKQNKPTDIKGTYFKSFHICTTMGPSIKLDLNDFN